MKAIKIFFSIIVLALFAFLSCSDDESVDLTNRKFVRIDQSAVYLTVGEKIKVTATVDKICGEAYKLVWSVLDNNIAVAESMDGNAASISAIAPGKTIIKVETEDGNLKYFTDLIVNDTQKVIKILSIGTGLANDATSNYLYDISKYANIPLEIGNAYVEGASFEEHTNNLLDKQSVYQYNLIAQDGKLTMLSDQSLKTIIKSKNWDYIVFEESMALSGLFVEYENNLPKLINQVKELSTNPDVKYCLHQLWAYAQGASESGFSNYENNQLAMYTAIVNAVDKVKQLSCIDIIIPSGTAIQNGRTSYIGEKMLKDDIHLNADVAKFSVACTWFSALFNQIDIKFNPTNLINYDIRLAKQAAAAAIRDGSNITVLVDFVNSPRRVYIDFGPKLSPAPFNNYKNPNDPGLVNMFDEKGEKTNWSIVVNQRFTGVLERGLENGLGFPKTASEDMFFSDGKFIPLSGFKVSGLMKGEKYTFTFYGHINDNGTQTLFTVKGKNEGSSTLVNDYNMERVAAIKGIEPNDDGTIFIELTPGPDNVQWAKFMGINAMVIMAEGY